MQRLTAQAGGNAAALRSDISRYAILSLGVTGEPQAETFLRNVQRSPQLLDIEQPPRDLDVILRQSIDTNLRVKRIGIESYVKPQDCSMRHSRFRGAPSGAPYPFLRPT